MEKRVLGLPKGTVAQGKTMNKYLIADEDLLCI